MSQHIGPRTISAIGGSIKRVGPYRIHTFPSELVTDGLVLNLDAGDPRSYPGSGTTWTDLSGNGNNGTFGASTAAPIYNNANGGSLVFDGTNDYVNRSPSVITGNQSFSWGAWIYPSTSGTPVLFGLNSVGQAMVSFWDSSDNKVRVGTWGSDKLISGTTILPSTWGHTFWTWDGTTLISYTNGVADGTTTGFTFNISSNNTTIGNAINAQYFGGKISSVKIYNRALSAAEVAQNYDALKVRYTSYTNTFTPTCGGGSGKVEVLCVAGGGGGGSFNGGGGGGGGLLYNSAFTVNSNTGIGVTIGASGIGDGRPFAGAAGASGAVGTNGGNSVFGSLTAIGGGVGATYGIREGVSGGSGGGNWGSLTFAGGTAGQGNAGGGGYPIGNNYTETAGGGGGAGSNGVNGGTSSNQPGAGGLGLLFNISGNSRFYAAGGAAGANRFGGSALGGSEIGGNGGTTSSLAGVAGVPNTGSGGGGAAYNGTPGSSADGGNGSNGIVIVRYPATDYNVELLVIGGGGGGGGNTGDGWNAGGGGAGGLIYYSSYPVSAGTKYTITVGAGGIPGISTASNNGSTTTQGANGGNSILGPLVAIGGGGGGASSGLTNPGIKNQGLNGGSGGGSGVNYGGGVHPGGFGVSGQGNSGGQGDNTGTGYSGGGGGAGGPGTGPGVHNVTNFGPGLVFSITGSSVSYAQGGQGGRDPATNAAANSGTGGDGARSAVNMLGQSGAGGSGIIIIAYQGPQRGVGGTVDTTSRPGYTLHKFTTTGTDFFIP